MRRWLPFSLLRLRVDRIALAGFALLVLVTAFVASLAPLVLNEIADQSVRGDLSAAPVDARGIEIIKDSAISSGDASDPTRIVAATGQFLDDDIPPSVEAVLGPWTWLADTARWTVSSKPIGESTVRLRLQQDALAHVRFTSGAAPTTTSHLVDPKTGHASTDAATAIPALEVALSSSTAGALQVSLGDVLVLAPDRTDRMIGASGVDSTARLAILVAGIFDVPAPDDPFWFSDQSLAIPQLRAVSPTVIISDTTVLLAPAEYLPLATDLENLQLSMRYRWRKDVTVGSLTEASVPALLDGARRMGSAFADPSVGGGLYPQPTLLTSLPNVLAAHEVRWRSAVVILATAAVGPTAIAGAALLLVALLLAVRRRPAISLARARGASRGQAAASLLLEACLTTIPAAVIGLAVALAIGLVLFGGLGGASGAGLAAAGPDLLPPLVATAVVALLAVTFAVVTAISGTATAASGALGARRLDRGLDASDAGTVGTAYQATGRFARLRSVSGRRIVVEGFVVVLAMVGAVALRGRGLAAVGAKGQIVGPDPVIAAVPLLIGFAAGLVTIRLLPFAMRFVAAIAATRRDLVPGFAFRRLARTGDGTSLVLVLLSAASVAAFSTLIFTGLDRLTALAAWRDVGADARVTREAGILPNGFDPTALPGVTAAATAWQGPGTVDQLGTRPSVLVLDAAAFQRVVAGTPADPGLPAAFFGPVAALAPLPVVISTAAAAAARLPLHQGSTFTLATLGGSLPVTVAAISDAVAGSDSGTGLVVLSRDQVAARLPGVRMPPTMALLRAPDSAIDAIRAAVAAQGAGLSVTSRAEEAASLRADPIDVAVMAGVLVALFIVVAYTVLASLAALALAAAGRAREVAHLTTLGLSAREALRLVLLETAPIVACAIVIGAIVGLGLFEVLEPGLGLAGVAAGGASSLPATTDPGIDPLGLAIPLAASLAGVAVGAIAGIAAQRRTVLTSALRAGLG
jgi:putative ABC transport system permease protein